MAQRPGRTVRLLLEVAGMAVCYFLAARIGLSFAIPPGNATAIWPASGIALAGVLAFGRPAVLGVFLGAALANMETSVSVPGALAIGIGNAAEALIAAALLRGRGRIASSRFRGARGVFVFTAVAMLAAAVAATVGVLTLRATGRLSWGALPENGVTWWLGDAAGIVIVTPFLGSIGAPARRPAAEARWAEALVAILSLALVSRALFGGVLDGRSSRDLLYLPFFLLLWLALRFEQRAVTSASLVLTACAVWGTSRGHGPYGGGPFPASLLHLQLLMITFALAGLAVVATVSRRRRAEGAVLLSRRRLVRVVAQRTSELRAALGVLRDESTERARCEAMERLRLATALDSAGEGIIITDASSTITHVNPSFERMTGYSRSDVVGKSPRLLKSGTHDADFYRHLWDTISRGEVWRGTFVDRKKDASVYDADTTIAPIRVDGRVDGYVAVTRDVTEQRAGERARHQAEKELFVTHEELRLAREIQQRLYPACAPLLPGLQAAGWTRTAVEAGGDYFDYFPLSGGCLGLVIGDVSGHGLGPALVMAQTRACLRALLLVTEDPGELLDRLNAFLVGDCGERCFVTLFFARIDPRTRSLSFAGAGHQSYLVRADGRVDTLAATGIPLGIRASATPSVGERTLERGDLLVLVTDGLEETLAPDESELGRAAVLEAASANRHRSASEIVAALVSTADAFAAGGVAIDDATAVVVKILH